MYRSDQKEEEKEWLTCPRFIGMVLLIWFGVVGGLTYIVPCARYYASDDPLIGEKTKVNAKFDALHWLTMLGPIIVGVGACLAETRVDKGMIWFICGFGGLLWLTCYICYVILFFISSEWKQTYEVISFDNWQRLNEQWINSSAEIWVYGTAVQHGRKSMPADCETDTPFVIKSGESEDSSKPLQLTREQVKGKAIRLRTILNVKTDSAGDGIIKKVEDEVKECLRKDEWLSDYGTRTIGAVSGFKEHLMITENGKKPQSLWRGAAGTGGFFAAGIVYLYDLARVSPVVNYELYKECNITEMPPVPCTSIGSCRIL